jgi:hypothetical protein
MRSRPSTAHPLRNNHTNAYQLASPSNHIDDGCYENELLSSPTSSNDALSSLPRPSSAPLSRILSRSPPTNTNRSINYKKRNYVRNALTQVHDGLMISAAKPKLRSYLSIKKSRPRRPWRNMAIQPAVDWQQLLSDATGNGNEVHDANNVGNNGIRQNRLNQPGKTKAFRDQIFVKKFIKIITPFASKEKRIAATKNKGFKAFKMVNRNNKGELGANIFTKSAKQKELDEKNILRRKYH